MTAWSANVCASSIYLSVKGATVLLASFGRVMEAISPSHSRAALPSLLARHPLGPVGYSDLLTFFTRH